MTEREKKSRRDSSVYAGAPRAYGQRDAARSDGTVLPLVADMPVGEQGERGKIALLFGIEVKWKEEGGKD